MTRLVKIASVYILPAPKRICIWSIVLSRQATLDIFLQNGTGIQMEELVAAYITQLSQRNRPEIRVRKDLVDEVYRHVIAQRQTDISISELVRVVDQFVRAAIRRGRAARIGRGQYVFGSVVDVLEFESNYIGGPLAYAPPNPVGRSGRSSESILIEQLSAQNTQLFAQIDRLQDLLKMKGSVLGLIIDDEFLCVSASTREILFETQDYAL